MVYCPIRCAVIAGKDEKAEKAKETKKDEKYKSNKC